MSISKDVIKQCLISKQREVDEAVIEPRPIDFEENVAQGDRPRVSIQKWTQTGYCQLLIS